MKIYENTDNKKFEAVKALLVYGNGKQVFCTLNPIEDNIILSGQGVNARNLSALFDLIGRDPVAAGMQWRNERVLAGSPARTIWYAPPQKRDVFFNCANSRLMKISGRPMWFPGLIFSAGAKDLKVYAYRSTGRPRRETKLFRAPFWNVFDSDSVCLPSGARTGRHSEEEWEEIFFRSAFSHPGGAVKRTMTRVEKLFPSLVKSGQKFPAAELIPAGKTVNNLMENCQ